MRRARKAAEHLRHTIELLPRDTRVAMLEGVEEFDRIIVGAYTDRHGGVCPMLAAHRHGGRTNFGSFARAWDRFTTARRPRAATEREVRTLRSYLESSLLRDEQHDKSMVELAAEIRSDMRVASERRAAAGEPEPEPLDTGERNRARELWERRGWAWLRPVRSYDVFREVLAHAEEQMSEQQAEQLLTARAEHSLEQAEAALDRAEAALRS